MSSQAVIITGMHRSGTSLAASILQKVGVNIGKKLLGAAPGNPEGHFEDVDFLKLHQDILASQGSSTEGWIVNFHREKISQHLVDRASALRDIKSLQGGLWGWKEPRTTLFLDFWYDLIPTAKFVFVYREPWDVVDSLFRRGLPADTAFIHNPSLAVETWIAYNRAILEFYGRIDSRAVLIHVGSLKGDASSFVGLLQEKLKLEVTSLEKATFTEGLMQNIPSHSDRIALLTKFYPKALDLIHTLNKVADLPSKADYLRPGEMHDSYRDWLLQDWLTAQRAGTSVKEIETKLGQVQAKLAQIQSQYEQTQAKLKQSQIELHQAEVRLEQSEIVLRHAKAYFATVQPRILELQSELQEKTGLIQSIENSPFWKARQLWHRMREFMRAGTVSG